MEKRRMESQDSHGGKYQRTESGYGGYDKSSSYSRSDSYNSNSYPQNSSGGYSSQNSSGGYSSQNTSGGYPSSQNSSSGYSSHNSSSGYSSSRDNNYSSRDSSSYSSRDNSYQSRDSGGYSRNNDYSKRDSGGYSRNNDYSSRDNYSRDRNDSYNSGGYRGRGGFGGRGRGGGRGGGFGGQSGDSWSCSSCKFSNYANRTSCYKCRTPKEGGGGGGGGRRWGDSNDGGWKKSGSGWGDRNSFGNSWGKSDDGGLVNWDEALKKADEMNAEKWASLPKIVKDLYVEDPAIASMTAEEVNEYRKSSSGMEVRCLNKEFPIPNPIKQFEQAFSSYPLILKEIAKQGFENPSAIQCQSWPILMKGYDMIGTSQTGSGKTLAFLLPALLHICAQPTPRWERPGPTVLVLAPTRELAQQIEREVLKFQYDNIRVVCCYGQGDKRNQIQKLNAMSEIVIATPGRLNDFVSQDLVNLMGVSYLVLDEADRMLDMGFEPQVRKIVMHIRPDRQTILTSATWPDEVQALANKLLTDPIHVIVGSLDLQAVDTITQRVVVCSVMEKEEKLLEFMKNMKPEDKAIIFVAQKITVDDLSVKLLEAGYAVESMHGGRNQRDREYSLRQLKTGRSKVLIATDVAARGIDINDITQVVNYDCPRDMEEYVHRVGRTGRAGRYGESLTLMCRDDWKVAGKLIEILEKSDQEVPRDLVRMKERFDRVREEGHGRFNRNGKIMGYGSNIRNGWTVA